MCDDLYGYMVKLGHKLVIAQECKDWDLVADALDEVQKLMYLVKKGG